MKTHFLMSLIIIVLSSSVFASDPNSWTRFRTPSFLVISDDSDLNVRRVGAKFESFHQTFEQILNTKLKIDAPTTIILFKTKASAEDFKTQKFDKFVETNDYFVSAETGNYIVLSVEDESNETYKLIFRDYAKYLLNKKFGETNLFLWIKKGLPEFLQTFRLKTEHTASLGDVSTSEFQLLRGAELISLEKFLSFNYDQWQNLNNNEKKFFQTQAQAFIRYLIQDARNTRRAQSIQFLELLAKDKKPEVALRQAFQTDFATFEKEFRQSLEQNLLKETSIALDRNQILDAAQWPIDSISPAEIKTLLGSLLLQMNRLAEAKSLLEQALALDAKSASARVFLGLTLIKQNNFVGGLELIEQAIRLDSNNYLWHYYYAFALSSENTDATGFVRSFAKEKANKMRESLDRSIELNSSFARSYRLLALINFVNNEDLNGGIEALEKALQISPGNPEYALETAQIYLRQERFDEAQKIGERVLKTADFAEVRIKARILLTSISSIREELKRMKNIKPIQNKTTPEPIQISQEEALNQALNEALRKPQAGEKRVIGFLTNIDCNDKGVDFTVRPQDQSITQVLKFNAIEFKKVFLRTFAPDIEGRQIDCGIRQPPSFVVATYRQEIDAKSKINGEIVALEFVPKDFKLKQ
jgi:tetratricopeptide (TPR) repeat protein